MTRDLEANPMIDPTHPRRTVTTFGSAAVRLRPALLIMLARVRAAEATLELGLAEVKQRCADAIQRLKRLGATWVEAGEPHEDDLANPDPMARMQAAARQAARQLRPGDAPLPKRHGVNVMLTATWDIAERSADEVLLLIDRLRFDAAADADLPDPPVKQSPRSEPEEQLQAIMAQVTEPPPEDRSPKFLYVARPTEQQLAQAAAEACEVARQRAGHIALASGHRLGELTSLMYMPAGADSRADRLMEQQRCAALLAAGSYDLREGEVVSEDPRSAAVTVSIHTTYCLE
jgi:hypothetical protein